VLASFADRLALATLPPAFGAATGQSSADISAQERVVEILGFLWHSHHRPCF
jgi:hypothetical protein